MSSLRILLTSLMNPFLALIELIKWIAQYFSEHRILLTEDSNCEINLFSIKQFPFMIFELFVLPLYASEFPTAIFFSNNVQHTAHNLYTICICICQLFIIFSFRLMHDAWWMIKSRMCRDITILFVNGRQIFIARQFENHSQHKMVSNLNNKTRFHRKYNHEKNAIGNKPKMR